MRFRELALLPLMLSASAMLLASQALAAETRAPTVVPEPECSARAGGAPGYLLPDETGKKECVPFTTAAVRPPKGYAGADFYVDEFSDERLRRRWAACKAEKACFDRISTMIREGAGGPRQPLAAGLPDVPRPAAFEAAASLEPRTSSIELTVPAGPFERIFLQQLDQVSLRGWYVRGDGIDDEKGGKVRALVIMSGTDTLAAIGQQAFWRRALLGLNRAGFDVLAYDRRGAGLSGGASGAHTLQQGRDLLAAIAALRGGEGLRVLTASGEALDGRRAAAALSAGAESMPVLLLGYSTGTMATSWAMTINFDKDCSYDLSSIVCLPARGLANIKGAILLADFASGPGYRPAGTARDHGLLIGAGESELNTAFAPSSATLAGMGTWPAAFFARGLWDHAASLEGTVRAFDRVRGLKELVVARGPHDFDRFHEDDQARIVKRMLAFARAATLGQQAVPGGRPWTSMKDLVGTAGPSRSTTNR